jgi:hypothetical protein
MRVRGGFSIIPWLVIGVALLMSYGARQRKWGLIVGERFIGSLMFLPFISGVFSVKGGLGGGGYIIKLEERG